MKFYPRLGIYKAPNVTFNPTTFEAYSYSWWRFVERIDGQVVFNSYRYSNSTAKHQSKVFWLLRNEFGITEMLTVQVPRGLKDLESALPYYESLISSLSETMKKPRTHKAKNAERSKLIEEYKAKLTLVKTVIRAKKRAARRLVAV